MADFGLYSALRGGESWEQKRSDAAMALGIAQMREQRSQQALQQQMHMEEGMQQAFDEIAKLDVLEQDAGRIKQLEQEQRKKIVQGVARYNGDLTKYMASGGIRDLHEYKNSILQSEQYKGAMANKMNLQQYVKDRSENKYIKPTVVDVPVTDEKTGQQALKPMKLSFEQQLKLFQDGKIDRLNYGGSENKINLGIEDFQNDFKDPLNPYSPDNYVSVSNVYEKALSKGAGEDYAKWHAQQYQKMVDAGGDPWRWNAKDPNELALKQQELAMKQQMHQARLAKLNGSGGGGPEMKTNVLGNYQKYTAPGSARPMPPQLRDFFNESLGLQRIKNGDSKFDGQGKYVYPGDALAMDGKTVVPMNDAEIISEPELYKDPNGRMFMKVTGMYSDNSTSIMDSGLLGTGLGQQPRKELKNQLGAADWWGTFSNKVPVELLIPVDKYFRDEQFRMLANDKLNVGDHVTNAAADYTDDAEMMDAQQMQDELNNSGY